MFQIAKNFSSSTRNVVKNISSEIVRECAKQGTTLSLEVVSLGVILLCLDTEHGISLTSQNDRSVLENFVNFCVKKLSGDCSPLVKTLQVQEFFISNPVDTERVLKKYQANIDEKAQPLWKEIIETENPNKEEQEILSQKIMVYVNMTYLLGSPTNAKVLTETSNALKSVMSKDDLTEFFILKKKPRAAHLKMVQEVVCGIRVFNKDAGHCGEGIRDIQADLQFAYNNTKSALSDKLERVSSHIKKLSDILFSLCNIDVERDVVIYDFPEGFTDENVEYLKGMLILSLQHESYVRNLMNSLNQVKIDIDRKLGEFRKVLDIIHDIVQYRMAVPTEKVFPHFTQVCILWQSLLICFYMLVEINKINEHIYVLSDMHACDKFLQKKIPIKDPIETNFSSQAISYELQRSELQYIPSNNQAVLLFTTPISKFCPYTFVVGNGLLLPSKTAAGYIKYENILFSFSTMDYARKFLSNIDRFHDKFMRVLRKYPQVVVFFDVYDIVSSHRTTEISKDELAIIRGNDCGVQTELHPIPYYKDKDYTWNIWDIRRKAVKLTNLKKCRTHSAQTEVSYHRLNVNLQTVEPNEKPSQTKCDAFTNIARMDASTDCNQDECKVGVNAMAVSGIRCTQPLKNYYTVPYRLTSNTK